MMTQMVVFFVMLYSLSSALNESQLKKLQRDVDGILRSANATEACTTKINDKGLVLYFKEKVLFDRGQADLKPEAKKIFVVLGPFLKSAPNDIHIEGHTDNLPVKTERYPSNWELSTARASNVARYFIEQEKLDPKRVAASGYGEYRPIAPNDTEINRALNRRVEIILTRMGTKQTGGKKHQPQQG